MSGLGPEDFPALGPLAGAGPGRGVSVLLADAGGRVLMQLRDDRPDVAWPAHWTLFGGSLEPGEALAEAACREIAEETGLALSAAELAPIGQLLSPLPARTRLFFVRAPRPVAPGEIRLGEGAGFAFLTRDQLAAFRLVPTLRPVLARHFGAG